MTVERLADDVYAIDAPFEDVPLQVYVIKGDPVTMIDPGVAQVPDRHLVDGLAEIGLRLDHIDLVVNTHGHHDHRGGNGVLRRHNPAVIVAAHRADADWIADTERYIDEQYLTLRPMWTPPDGFLERIRSLCGEDVAVDRYLDDEDEIDLGGRQRLLVRHVPAHTSGHVVFFHEPGKVLFTGDALQARGTPLWRRLPFFPSYRSVREYQRSLDYFDESGAAVVGTAHNEVCMPHRAAQLVAESRKFVDEITGFLAHQLRTAGTLTVPDAVRAVSAHWPRFGVGAQLFMTVCAHLELLVEGGSARYSGDPEVGFEPITTQKEG